MAIKIENHSATKLPRHINSWIDKIINSLPKEHVRGIERLRLVDVIDDPRLPAPHRGRTPGLYHPRQGTQSAWLEVSVNALLPPSKSFLKKLVPRFSLKGNLAAVVFSLIGQHYYLTMRHSVKKGQLETSVRAYTEKQLRAWSEREHSVRSRLLKPLQPTLERWARTLQKRAAIEKRKNAR